VPRNPTGECVVQKPEQSLLKTVVLQFITFIERDTNETNSIMILEAQD
jgi:hypothetical protein